jgi:hypothetical protein
VNFLALTCGTEAAGSPFYRGLVMEANR